MEKIISKITEDILKEQVREDVEKKIKEFKKTKEYSALIEKEMKAIIKDQCYGFDYGTESYIQENTKKMVESYVNSKEQKDKIIKAAKNLIKNDTENLIEGILDDTNSWESLHEYVKNIIQKSLECAAKQIDAVLKKEMEESNS